MNDLNEIWKHQKKANHFTFPTSVRLRADVDAMLQTVLQTHSHLTQTQIINDCLYTILRQVTAS